MSRNKKLFAGLLGLLVVAAGTVALAVHGHTIDVLAPRGPIGQQERRLMGFAILLSAIVVIPVYLLTIGIALKYRESNHKGHKKYRPNSDHSRLFEAVWWGIPLIIITILSVVTWQSSHALDPFKPLASTTKPLTVDVVSLDWKWLFLYPAQQVASVNQVALPVNTPINFHITSDTVMNSFWIPQLGSQIYAMPGMVTQLNLMADQTGDYYGSPANITGKGFSTMTFDTKVLSPSAFNAWVATAARSTTKLSLQTYNQLARPSQDNPVAYYSSPANGLFTYTVMKYMEPGLAQ